MGAYKELTEEEKRRIADLYKNTRLSISGIADFLGYCPSTVSKYKDYTK